LGGDVCMDAEKMLEVIETGAWVPKKKTDNVNQQKRE
jgi:hypothetical protein